MNLKRLLTAALALAALFLSAGCASGILGSAATRIEASAPTGEKVTVVLPKEYEAKDLNLVYNPVTKVFELKATTLKASSQALVQSATQAQAEATARIAAVTDKLATAVLTRTTP